MHRSGADSSLAALQAGASLPGHVLDVVVLTADGGLLATLRDASSAEQAIWHAPSPDAAVDLLIGGRCAVLIADLGALRGDAAAFFDRLHAQFPELVLLATGRREEEGAVASLISSGLIYRLLHKPVSPARAGLFLAAATRRYHELHNTASDPIGMATIKTVAMRPKLARGLIAGAVLLIVAVTVLLLWSSGDAPAPSIVPQQVSSASPEEQIATLMGRAQIAFARDQLAEPRGDNALEHYRAVLALQPDHAAAKAGVARVAAGLEQRVVAALEARNAPQGRVALAALQHAEPSHPRLDALREQLISVSRSAAAVSASPANPTTLAAPPGQAASVRAATAAERGAVDAEPASDVDTRTRPEASAAAAADEAGSDAPDAEDLQRATQLRERGALLAPPGANAYEALAALRVAYPDAEALRAEEQRLAFALLEQARTALAASNLDEAAVFLGRAEQLVPGMATTTALQKQLAAAQTERSFATNIVQAGTLRRTREVAAVYPRDAQRDGVEGWVDVEFTIAADGSTTDLIARRAQPTGVFEKSAIDSVRRWRFQPVMRNGEAVPQRAVLHVRFTLN